MIGICIAGIPEICSGELRSATRVSHELLQRFEFMIIINEIFPSEIFRMPFYFFYYILK